jgi:hypothetical protein
MRCSRLSLWSWGRFWIRFEGTSRALTGLKGLKG